jgi:hypothetical protein
MSDQLTSVYSPFDFAEELQLLAEEIVDLLIRKNTDYSGDLEGSPFANFIFTAEAIGMKTEDSIFYEIAKKYKRAVNLLKSPQSAVKEESLEDAIRDIIGSGILFLLYKKSEKYSAINRLEDYARQ